MSNNKLTYIYLCIHYLFARKLRGKSILLTKQKRIEALQRIHVGQRKNTTNAQVIYTQKAINKK